MEKDFYEYLELIETHGSSILKEQYLCIMLRKFPEAEQFFRFVFNDTVYGLGEKTFKNAFPKSTASKEKHISDYLFKEVDYEPTAIGHEYQLRALYDIAKKVEIKSGNDQIIYISNIFRQLKKIEKKWWCRALLHDLRAGVQVKTINNVFKQLNLKPIAKFSLQLCGKIDVYDEKAVAKKLCFPCSMECKYDGIRIQAEVFPIEIEFEDIDGRPLEKEEMHCRLTSRRGKDRTDMYPEIVKDLKMFFFGQHVILDGEVIADSFQQLTRLDNKSRRRYIIWDILNDEKLNYLSRWDNLVSITEEVGIKRINIKEETNDSAKLNAESCICLVEHYSCNNIKELQEYYEDLNSRGEEGIIIKLDDKVYNRNSRNHMFKCKKVFDADLQIIGWKYGEGKRANKVATLKLVDASGTIWVDVGSGINDEMCEELTSQVEDSNFAIPEEEPEFMNKICEILYNEKTETGSLRFPRFIRIRNDKDEADDLSGGI